MIRSYEPGDREACLSLFDGNVPEFFDPSERESFVAFLKQPPVGARYLVLEEEGRILGCGGLLVAPDGESVGLCWGMVDRSRQRSGLGRRLTEARISAARAMPGMTSIRLDTSRHTRGFYARFGFEPKAVTKDGYGPGLDRWDMVLCL